MAARRHYTPKARDLYPMPVKEVLDHPDFIALPAAGRGMVFSLLLFYWSSRCKPLPGAEDRLFVVAQAHRPTWRTNKATVLKIFRDVQPGLDAYFQARESKATTLSFAGSKMNAKRRAEAMEQKHALAPVPQPFEMGLTIRRDPNKADRPAAPENRPARKLMTDKPRFR